MHLGHIKSLSIRYFPFDSSAKLCRELLRRVNVPAVRSTNAKCEINSTVESKPGSIPAVDVMYADGTTDTFTQQGDYPASVDTILERIQYKRDVIEMDEIKPWTKGILTDKWVTHGENKWFKT